MPDSTDRGERLRDVTALLSMPLVMLPIAVGALVGMVFVVLPPYFGSPDDRIGGPLLVLAYVAILLGTLAVTSLASGFLWITLVRPFLPYATVRKWLLYGPQIPPLTRAYIGYLDFLYGES